MVEADIPGGGMSAKKDLTGQRFGRLVVVRDTGEKRHRNVVWECVCDCGKIAEVSTSRLSWGYTSSCGCLYREYLASPPPAAMISAAAIANRKYPIGTNRAKLYVKALTHWYVRKRLLNQGIKDPTPEEIEFKRQLLQAKRNLKGTLKKLKQIMEVENESGVTDLS